MGKQTVKKRGNYYWHRDPISGQRRSTKCTSKKAAEIYHAAREALAADPHHATKEAAKLGEWVQKMLRAKEASKAEGTVQMYRIKAGHLLRIFGPDFPLHTLTAGLVDDYITQRLEEGAVQSTIYREITVTMGQVIKAARRAKACDVDLRSMMPTDWSVKYTPRTRNLTQDEVKNLLPQFTEEQAAAVAFTIATGSRWGEVNRAEPEDLNITEMTCRIRGTKTVASARVIPVLPQFGSLWLMVTQFWTKHGRAPRYPRANESMKAACKRAEIDPCTPNDLRRTHASWLILMGVEQGLVSRCLGHKDGTMVHRVYGKITGPQLSRTVSGQIDAGTISTQSEFFADLSESDPAENNDTAPWRNGRRRGFKILKTPAENSHVVEITQPGTAGDRCRTVGGGTKSTHSDTVEAPFLSISLTREQFDALGQSDRDTLTRLVTGGAS